MGLIGYLLKNDRKNLYMGISALTEQVGDLVKELQADRRDRASDRERDLLRLSKLESAFSKLVGEHNAAMSGVGHVHHRAADTGGG